jgi:hypothetical protein
MEVDAQVAHIAKLLGREIVSMRFDRAWRVEQRCPVCEVMIGMTFSASPPSDVARVFERVFELYDEHRCHVRGPVFRARAEREATRLAERAAAIREIERDSPADGMPSLYERAERESVVLAERAQTL